MNKVKLPTKKALTNLIIELKKDLDTWDMEEMDVTVACSGSDRDDWAFQTGDNSYTGACYSYHHWAIGTISKDTNSKELATELLDQLDESLAYDSLMKEC